MLHWHIILFAQCVTSIVAFFVGNSPNPCANDGFRLNDTCMCQPYFYPNGACTSRQCLNGGRQYQYSDPGSACVCPPGFRGRFCEAQACPRKQSKGIMVNSKSIFQPEYKTAVVLYVFTHDLKDKIQTFNDDFFSATCHLLDTFKSIIFFSVEGHDTYRTGEVNSCISDFNGILPVNESSITEDLIISALQYLNAKSTLIIVTNLKADFNDKFNIIVQQLITLGVTANTFLYAPPFVDFLDIYDGPDYSPYKTLAEKTGGFYVTPYDTLQNVLLGNLTVSQAIAKLVPVIIENHPIASGPFNPAIPAPLYSENNQFSFTFRFSNITTVSLSLNDITSGKKYTLDDAVCTDIGLNKLYLFTFEQKLSYMQITPPSKNLLIYAQPAFSVGLAITTDITVDASFSSVPSPTAVNVSGAISKLPVGVNLVVSAGGSEIVGLQPSNGAFAFSASVSQQLRDVRGQLDCLFPQAVGYITACDVNATAWLQVSDSETNSAALAPLFCAAPQDMSNFVGVDVEDFPVLRRMLEVGDDDQHCYQPSKASYAKAARPKAFAILIDDNATLTDGLLINPGNIFEKLVPMFENNELDSVFSTILQNSNNFAPGSAGNVSDLLNNILNNLKNSSPSFFDMTQIIEYMESKASLFADVFVVLRSSVAENSLNDDSNFYDSFVRIYSMRARIHFVLLKDSADPLSATFLQLAANTGGIAHIFDSVSDILEFFNRFDSFILNRELIRFEEFEKMSGLYSVPLYLKQNETISIVLESPKIAYVKINTNPEILSPWLDFGSLQIFRYTCNTSQAIYAGILGGGERTSVRIYTDDTTSLSSIAFANGNRTDDFYGPEFGQRMFTVFALENASWTGSIYESLNDTETPALLLNDLLQIDSCNSSFNYFMNLAWQCPKKKQLYRFEVKTSDTLRSFPFICNYNADKKCGAHGEQFDQDTCSCDAGWTGSVCTTPVCQNNGQELPAGTCNCTNDFAGFFCQYVMLNGNTSSVIPTYKAIRTSLIFVIEEAEDIQNYVSIFKNLALGDLQNNEIIIVSYNNEKITTRMIGFSTTLLQSVLDFTFQPNQTGDLAEEALLRALNLQTTSRSDVFWLMSSVYTAGAARDKAIPNDIQDEVISTAANKRATIRTFYPPSCNDSLTDPLIRKVSVGTLATPIGIDNFSALLSTKYILKGRASSTVWSTVFFSTDGSLNSITINMPSDVTAAFVTLYGFEKLLQDGSNATSIGGNVFTLTSSSPSTALAWSVVGSATHHMIIVEFLSSQRIAYGISQNIHTQNDYFSVLVAGKDNWLNILWDGQDVPSTPSTSPDDYKNYVNVQVWPVYGDASVNWASPGSKLIATVNSNHNYGFLPHLPDCNSYSGFLAKIYASANSKYIYLPCVTLQNSTCLNGALVDGACECSSGFSGFDCSIPNCLNGGTPSGSICNCPPLTSGVFCETVSSNITRTQLFIIDVASTQLDEIKGAVISAALYYNFSKTTTRLAQTSKPFDFGILQYHNAFNSIIRNMNSSAASYKKTFEVLVDELYGFEEFDVRNVFLITDANISSETVNSLDVRSLLQDSGFNLLSCGYRANIDLLSAWGDVVRVEDAAHLAAVIVSSNEGSDVPFVAPTEPTTQPPTTTPQPYCTQLAMADIYFIIDFTFNRTDLLQISDIITNFYDELWANSKFLGNATTFCSSDAQYDAFNTRVSGMAYFGSSFSSGIRPSMCSDAMSMIVKTLNATSMPGASNNMTAILRLLAGNLYFSKTCKCQRNLTHSPMIPQLMFWLPRTAEYEGNDDLFADLSGFSHYFIPYAVQNNTGGNDLWSKMESIYPSVTKDRKTLVATLWDYLCKITNATGPYPQPREDVLRRTDDDLMAHREQPHLIWQGVENIFRWT